MLLDIHLSLRTTLNRTDLCPYRIALESNLALRQLQGEQIDFFAKHTPHITLYQANLDINSTEELLNATAIAIGNATTPCLVKWPSANRAILSGPYAMYFIPNNACLQNLSNSIVKGLRQYMHRPPTIPAWVYNLPRGQRRRALDLIESYGSPNVLERFVPHVTVGYDTTPLPFRRRHALKELGPTPNPCTARLAAVTIALVGVGGSVLQNGVLGQVSLYIKPQPNDATSAY